MNIYKQKIQSNPLFFQQSKMTKNNPTSEPIKTYVRIFPSSGIDPILDSQFEILDGNTILSKNKNSCNANKIKMHSFNYVFTNQFQYAKQIQHIDLVQQCLQGKNQIVVAEIGREFINSFMLGTAEDPGFVISAFHGIFQQIHHSSSNLQQKVSDNTNKISERHFSVKKQQNISISIFSSEGSSNKFIDLILGQRFTFYSKRDMDQYKDFYDKQIQSMRQFLITMKLALIRYRQCCKQGDPIIFRVIVDCYDQLLSVNYSSSLHIVVCQAQSKIIRNICKKIQFSFSGSHLRGEDHGSLANYLQRYLRKSKLIYIYGVPFRKTTLQKSQQIFNFLEIIKNKSAQVSSSIINVRLDQQIEKLNRFVVPKYKYRFQNLNHKEINLLISLLEKTCNFLAQVEKKWRIYCQIFKEKLQLQKDFYEQERFPISLQIQEYNVKSFMISKVYRLCQIYQMDDLSTHMQRLRTLKNQVTIQYKAILNSKQFIALSYNSNISQFVKYYEMCVSEIMSNIKVLFGFRYRWAQVYNVNISEHIRIQNIMDSKAFRQLINQLRNQAKKALQKDDIILRKLSIKNQNKIENEKNSKNQAKSVEHAAKQIIPKQLSLRQSQIYKQNNRQKRLRKNEMSRFNIMSNKISETCQISLNEVKKSNYQHINQKNNQSFLGVSRIITKKGIKHSRNFGSSIIITRQFSQEKQNYNFYLPKIAIIHQKKTKR